MYELIAIRFLASDDGTHNHIDVVGYESMHMPTEPIMIPPRRVIQRQMLGEKFWVVVDGEKVDVTGGDCPQCGYEPQLTTAKGNEPLFALPQK